MVKLLKYSWSNYNLKTVRWNDKKENRFERWLSVYTWRPVAAWDVSQGHQSTRWTQLLEHINSRKTFVKPHIIFFKFHINVLLCVGLSNKIPVKYVLGLESLTLMKECCSKALYVLIEYHRWTTGGPRVDHGWSSERHLKAVVLSEQGRVNGFDDHWLVHSELQRRHTASAQQRLLATTT